MQELLAQQKITNSRLLRIENKNLEMKNILVGILESSLVIKDIIGAIKSFVDVSTDATENLINEIKILSEKNVTPDEGRSSITLDSDVIGYSAIMIKDSINALSDSITEHTIEQMDQTDQLKNIESLLISLKDNTLDKDIGSLIIDNITASNIESINSNVAGTLEVSTLNVKDGISISSSGLTDEEKREAIAREEAIIKLLSEIKGGLETKPPVPPKDEKGFFGKTFENIKGFLDPTKTSSKGIMVPIFRLFGPALLLGMSSGIIGGIKEYMKTGEWSKSIAAFAGDTIEFLTAGIVDSKSVKGAFKDAQDYVTDWFDPFLGPMIDLYLDGLGRVGDFFIGMFDTYMSIYKTSFEFVTGAIETITPIIKDTFNSVSDFFSDTFNTLTTTFKTTFDRIIKGIKSILDFLDDKINQFKRSVDANEQSKENERLLKYDQQDNDLLEGIDVSKPIKERKMKESSSVVNDSGVIFTPYKSTIDNRKIRKTNKFPMDELEMIELKGDDKLRTQSILNSLNNVPLLNPDSLKQASMSNVNVAIVNNNNNTTVVGGATSQSFNMYSPPPTNNSGRPTFSR